MQAISLLRATDGQDVIEYGLLIATIAILVLLAVDSFGAALKNWFDALAVVIANA